MRKLLAIVMTFAIAFGTSNVVNAAETTCVENDDIQSSTAEEATTYVLSEGNFSVSSGVMACNQNMGHGTYKVAYEVTESCELYMWVDDFTTIKVADLNAVYGTVEFTVPLFTTYRGWQLWTKDSSNTSTVYYWIEITK